MRIGLWIAAAAVLTLLGCGGNQPVQIRIRNASSQDMTNFWLGAGGTSGISTTFSKIPAGTTTGYRGFSTVRANYSKCNFLMQNGKQYIVNTYPLPNGTSDELAPGNYTFSYDLVGDSGTLTITRDP